MIFSTFFFVAIFLGGEIQNCKADVGLEFADGHESKSVNNFFERLDAKLSTLPTKDDITTLTNEMATLSKKLELLQNDVQYLMSMSNNNHRQQIKSGRTRRSIEVPDFVASDYRLGILISQIQNTSLNESCQFIDQLLAVEKDQFAILDEIRNKSSKLLHSRTLSSCGTGESGLDSTNPSIAQSNPVGATTPRNRRTTVKTRPILDTAGTVILRRSSLTPRKTNVTDFNKDWEAYENGFGNVQGDFWLGLETIHRLTEEGNTQLRVDVENYNGEKKYALYDTFKVANATKKYRLTIDGYSGTAGDCFIYNNKQDFNAYAADNDELLNICPTLNSFGWWYDDSSCSYIFTNSEYRNSSYDGTPELVKLWYYAAGQTYALKTAEMTILKPQ